MRPNGSGYNGKRIAGSAPDCSSSRTYASDIGTCSMKPSNVVLCIKVAPSVCASLGPSNLAISMHSARRNSLSRIHDMSFPLSLTLDFA
jgi:hypothetical protein